MPKFARFWHEPSDLAGAGEAASADPYKEERIWLGVTIMLIWLLLLL
jgi:hypothetical protein